MNFNIGIDYHVQRGSQRAWVRVAEFKDKKAAIKILDKAIKNYK